MTANESLSDWIDVVGLVLYSVSTRRIAIFRRGPMDSGAGHWEFPGGKVDAGESREQALAREVFEELDLKVEVNGLSYIDHVKYKYPAKKIQLHLYEFQVPDENIKFCLTDHDQYRWVEILELDTIYFSPADHLLLNQVKAFVQNH